MKETIERLKLSKAKHEDGQRAEGEKEGSDWATNAAEYDELLGLWNATFSEAVLSGKPRDYADAIAAAAGWESWSEFEEHSLCIEKGPRITRGYLNGFLSGAHNVWEKVRDQV